MFDWGAQAVTDILDCGLYEALQKIQKRPWLYDGLDKWLEKLEVMKKYILCCVSVILSKAYSDKKRYVKVLNLPEY